MRNYRLFETFSDVFLELIVSVVSRQPDVGVSESGYLVLSFQNIDQ